jgi:hypothetical protein
MNELEALYKTYPLYRELFAEQLAFVLSPSKYKTALCSSRAGKTTAIAVDFLDTCNSKSNTMCFYLALTKESVERIFLPVVRPLIEKYKLKCQLQKNRVLFDNGSQLIFTSADSDRMVETLRGVKLAKAAIDEAASFNQTRLMYLMDEVLELRLADLKGMLILTGTPAAHCSGVFHDITNVNPVGWDVHTWDCFDNPYVAANMKDTLEKFMMRKQIDINHPKIQREFYGKWVTDTDELMIKPYHIEALPTAYNNEEYFSVVGLDMGYNDNTVVSIIVWRKHFPKAYIVKTISLNGKKANEIAQVTGKGMVTQLADILTKVKATYQPRRIVGDYAGGSAQIIWDEFKHKYNLFIENAKKNEKTHYIELFNDALINKELVVCPNETTELQKEMKSVVWNDTHTKESEHVPCDHLDATLYAYREAFAYLEKIQVKKATTPDIEAQNMLKKFEEQWRRKQDQEEDDFLYEVKGHISKEEDSFWK